MKILLISDIHYGKDVNYPSLKGEEYTNSFGTYFESFVESLQKVIKKHDLVINLGDSIQEINQKEDKDNFNNIKNILGKPGKVVKTVIGNHDTRNLSVDNITKLIDEENIFYSFDMGGYHHIVLGSREEIWGNSYPIDNEQINWLISDLNHTELFTIVYVHFPIDDQNIDNNYYFKDYQQLAFLDKKEEIRGILEASQKVISVFNGHLHFFNESHINGIRYITTPSFSENDGHSRPCAKCLSVNVTKNQLTYELLEIDS